ncbi:MAG: prolyl oligopeptidase family serine peptidase [Planctomycetota bacterium]
MKTSRHPLPFRTLVFLCGLASPLPAEEEAAPPAAAPVATHWLALAPVDGRGRRPFRPDVVFERHLLDPASPPPEEGQTLTGEGGREGTWRSVTPGEDGRVSAGRIGYAYAAVEASERRVWMAELRGASTLFVNGTPHSGDIYGQGLIRTPIVLREGVNHLYVTGTRGNFRLGFEAPPAPSFLASYDSTLPDLVAGSEVAPDLGLIVVNASEEAAPAARLRVSIRVGGAIVALTDAVEVPPLAALTQQKLAVSMPDVTADAAEGEAVVVAALLRGEDVVHRRTYDTAVRDAGEPYRRTFRSAIDDSTQFFAVRPPTGDAETEGGMGLVLTLHGAGVDALNQARAYGPKPDFWIVAPTNRRPFGFDWQDWGRIDAYEVLGISLGDTAVDPRRVHLTGHSMGGHGTWHLAANDPDGFASVAPSAGWISFDSYGGRPEGRLTRLWHAADAASDTLSLLGNLGQPPVYILHGSEDDNVPPREAREMAAKLEGVNPRLQVHFQEGAGHWWDGDPAPGAACVDWPGFFEMFRAHRIPASPPEIAFTTVDPAVDAMHHWIWVDQPLQYGEPLRVKAWIESDPPLVHIETHNVRRLSCLLEMLDGLEEAGVLLDGQPLEEAEHGYVRVDGTWRPAEGRLPPREKAPGRSGPLKRAFHNRFVMVVGTAGDDAEDEALLARARYDAEVWQYRGNGRAFLIEDTAFREGGFGGRNVILYGNADTNAAWEAVVPADCPIQVRRGEVAAGSREYEGEDLGVLFVYPRRGESHALVGVVGDTGPEGLRLGYTTACFVSGVGYPDFVVYGPEILERGDEGVRTAGFFDYRWQLAQD